MSRARQKGVHLSEAEMQRVVGAERTASGMPMPTQIISNGEFNPLPQTEQQRQVAGLINDYADKYGRKLGLIGAGSCVRHRAWRPASWHPMRCSVRCGW